ncbi:YppF family protein [Bacillus sp. Marseille-P3661]|uniref:YppF family protein n=1 Tax=Bacillus sp. Marseille-P3661 TaxID=1936234 RepID=UPI000C81EE3F|nr:YppF family protein [Bacillus sp. Marseille-P3661]
MTLETLIKQYVEVKKDHPTNVNDLLDFLKRGYIQGTLSFAEYRRLMHELEQRGATIA